MRKKIASVFLAFVMVLGLLPVTAFAAGSASWPGAMNYNAANNQVTETASLTAANRTEMKWAYPLNTTVSGGGYSTAYYAGTQVIVDGYLYTTGAGKLHKINTATGEGTAIADAGSTSSYYDYLCYADGYLLVATETKLEAFDLAGTSLGSVDGTYGYYHPIQYHDGYAVCNGFIYKLEKSDDAVTFSQAGSSAIGGDTFNWSSGVFLNGLFYVASKTTVYAVDYTTNTVTDSYVFDTDRTATSNTQGGAAYDAATGRLFWGTYTYNNYIHSIQIDTDGKFAADSYMGADAGQKSVCTPVVYNGRVYLAGQQGRMCVLNASDLSQVYSYVTLGGGKVQGTPILSTAGGQVRIYVQCYDGDVYLFTDNGDSGSAVKLGKTDNRTGVLYPNAGFEQYAMDENGNFYCCNESGYLYCFGVSACEVPTIETDLATKQVKYALNAAEVAPLEVSAAVSDGGTLSWQWQSSADKTVWTDISGANEASYTPSVAAEGTTYYRCVIANTKDGSTAKTVSSAANVLVKVLSTDTTLNVMVNGGNSATGSKPAKAELKDGLLLLENRTDKVTNLWLGTADGTIEGIEVYAGIPQGKNVPSFTKKTGSNVYDGTTYNGYYRYSPYTLPIVARVDVKAEDGVSSDSHYVVIDSDTAGSYAVDVTGFTADAETYFRSESGISFTGAGQTVALTPVTANIGSGEVDTSYWTWESSDPAVATVDENGVVTAIGGGTATITFAAGRVTAVCAVTSAADKHVHTYDNGTCSVCGTAEPAAVSVHFSMIDKDGKVAVSKDGTTELYKHALTVGDTDCDGAVTLNDAFVALHTQHSANGAADFATESTVYGLSITKLWGVETGSVGYMLNNTYASGLLTALQNNDEVAAFLYRDTTDWSDVYTYISGQTTVTAGKETAYTVSGTAVPNGASVKVYDSTGAAISGMNTTVGADGTFALTFAAAGTYTVEVNGTCSYTGSVWDTASGGYAAKDFTAAPVVPSRITVEVMPYTKATVYVTLSDKTGSFVTGKTGKEIYRLPVTAEDDSSAPDGKVSLVEVMTALHAQQHPNGASAFSATSGWAAKLWGDTSGSFGYYFNDVYLSGSGTKTGTNGREFRDELMATAAEDGDTLNFWIYQSGGWSDSYTWFQKVSASAVAGKAKTLTVNGASWGSAKAPEGALVKVTDEYGAEQTALDTTVGADGSFTITFPAAGVYTVEVRTNGTNYFVPSRCTVHVTKANTTTTADVVYISVSDPNGVTYHPRTGYPYEAGETAYSLLLKTGLEVRGSTDHQWGGVYVESIAGIGEFDEGNQSGWMYRVNGEFPEASSSLYALSPGDEVEWLYTRNLGKDVGGGVIPFVSNAAMVEELIASIGTVTRNSGTLIQAARAAYDSLTAAEKKLVSNYSVLLAAEAAYAKLTAQLAFNDVTESDYFYNAVKWAVKAGITNGTTETTFSPYASCTRAQMVTFLWRAAGEPAAKRTANAFTDVSADAYYYEALLWAVERGITNGTTATTFSPNAACTRGQMAAFLYRYAGMPAVDGANPFADVTGSDYYCTAVTWAANRGITNGTTATTYSPANPCTRGQMVTFLYRFLAE